MTNDPVDEIVRQFRAEAMADIDRRLASLEQRLRAFSAQAAGVVPGGRRFNLISLGEAAQIAGLSKTRMRSVCARHLYGANAGFGYKSGARWHVVDDSPFRDWLRRRASD